MAIEVRKIPQGNRYEISVDGQLAGFLEYESRDENVLALTHTIVESRFRGQGLAGKLVTTALDEARLNGHSVLPYCSYVQAFIGEHPDYVDLVPVENRADFGL